MEIEKYDVNLDYSGYIIDPTSFRSFPAPLMGSRFATGRMAYQNLDFWQVGALTDFTKGINQKFLVDPSQYYYSEGVDVSKEGEIRLERELENLADFPVDKGTVTAKYRTKDTLYLGTSTGYVLKTTDGITFTTKQAGTTKIYDFYEMDGNLYLTRGEKNVMKLVSSNWVEVTFSLTGTLTFTNGSDLVTGVDSKFVAEIWVGAYIRLEADAEWAIVKSITDNTNLVLTQNYSPAGGSGASTRSLRDLYFVEAESETAFGLFNDGIRSTIDGETFIPEPPDPLWELPSSEGVALNFVSISNGGWLVGARRGLWNFRAGGSAVNLWMFQDYASENNFRGMDKWMWYGIFSVEGQGIWYTEGSGIHPTNLNWREDPFKVTSCKDILTSGWDVFALVSDGTSWYLARCNMINSKVPKFWWIVKKLSKEPVMLSSFSSEKVFVHYLDKTTEVYNKISGKYQASGYLITPLIDENLILLQKLYRSISAIFSKFPTGTKATLDYRLKEETSFPTSEAKEFNATSDFSITKKLKNPVVNNRIQIKIILKSESETHLESPLMTDLLWRYILNRPKEEEKQKRVWHFTILAQDQLEKRDFDKEELGLDDPRSRQDILDAIWETKSKEEILNYIGPDNVATEAFVIKYNGAGDSCLAIIDRTNYKISTYVDSVLDKEFEYEDKTIVDLVAEINGEDDYSCTIDNSVGADLANELMPDKDLQIKGGASVYLGTDVHAVIPTSQAPSQYKLGIEGRGGDRINLSLREV